MTREHVFWRWIITSPRYGSWRIQFVPRCRALYAGFGPRCLLRADHVRDRPLNDPPANTTVLASKHYTIVRRGREW